MKSKYIWSSALLLVVILAALLVRTEGQYLQFTRSLSQLDAQIHWIKTEVGPERTVLSFEVIFHNTSTLPIWVEALNTQLSIGGKFAGGYSITEGNYRILPGERRAIPLAIPLWSERRAMLALAKERGAKLSLSGRARVGIGVGAGRLTAFYQLSGSFSLKDEHGL